MTLAPLTLPSRAQVLLSSLCRMRDDLTQVLDERAPDLPEYDDEEFFLEMRGQALVCAQTLLRSFREIEQTLAALDEVMAREFVQDTEVARATWEFEAVLNRLSQDYRRMGFWERECEVDDETALFYLKAIYAHTLEEIRDWLEDFVYALEHPVGNQIVFQTQLQLSAAPEATLLKIWFEANIPEEKRDSCFWSIVAGIALGVYLS